MWLLLFTGVLIITLAIKKVLDFSVRKEHNPVKMEQGINAIIFWGGISVVLGFFAHFFGMYQAMIVISKAPEISSAVVAEGYAASLTTILFGLVIFLFSAIMWFLLRWKYKNIVLKTG
jgi:hypothetical protein